MTKHLITGTTFAEKVRYNVLNALDSAPPTSNGYGRRFISHTTIGQDVAADVFALFGIDTILPEPMFGNFIGNHFLDGASVHKHKDTAPNGFHHVRCNLAIEMPELGGQPINNGVELTVSRGDIWICFASIDEHWSTPICGGSRVILSLGALVEKSLAEFVRNRVKT